MTTEFEWQGWHPSWNACIQQALPQLDDSYVKSLKLSRDWLPGADALFNAFNLPLEKVNYILLGESPYPRKESANGYAFWDAAVTDIWSTTGLSKPVNRATSLRNIIKMLLVAEGLLSPDNTGQEAIAAINKTGLVQTNTAFFQNFLQHGFLLLNATLVLQPDKVRFDAKMWRPFLKEILNGLIQARPTAKLILLGNIANEIEGLIPIDPKHAFYAEHPYNLSFIHNPTVLDFFKPLHLLRENQ